MKRALIAAALCAAAVAGVGPAQAQVQAYYPPPFTVRPALPESMPTLPPFSATAPDDIAGTAKHAIAATPDCGPANPQGGMPSMLTGTCP